MKDLPPDLGPRSRPPVTPCFDARIAVCCDDAATGERLAAALRKAGFVLTRASSRESLASARSIAGVIELLICEVDSTAAPTWQDLLKHVQPKIGTIGLTSHQDARWIIDCVRRHDADGAALLIVEHIKSAAEHTIQGLRAARAQTASRPVS